MLFVYDSSASVRRTSMREKSALSWKEAREEAKMLRGSAASDEDEEEGNNQQLQPPTSQQAAPPQQQPTHLQPTQSKGPPTLASVATAPASKPQQANQQPPPIKHEPRQPPKKTVVGSPKVKLNFILVTTQTILC